MSAHIVSLLATLILSVVAGDHLDDTLGIDVDTDFSNQSTGVPNRKAGEPNLEIRKYDAGEVGASIKEEAAISESSDPLLSLVILFVVTMLLLASIIELVTALALVVILILHIRSSKR